MNWITDTLAEFSRSIGLPDGALEDKDAMRLELDGGGWIDIVDVAQAWLPHVLVCRGHPLAMDRALRQRRALVLANFREASPWPVLTAQEGDDLVFGVRIPARHFDLSALDQALTHLAGLHSRAGQTT